MVFKNQEEAILFEQKIHPSLRPLIGKWQVKRFYFKLKKDKQYYFDDWVEIVQKRKNIAFCEGDGNVIVDYMNENAVSWKEDFNLLYIDKLGKLTKAKREFVFKSENNKITKICREEILGFIEYSADFLSYHGSYQCCADFYKLTIKIENKNKIFMIYEVIGKGKDYAMISLLELI